MVDETPTIADDQIPTAIDAANEAADEAAIDTGINAASEPSVPRHLDDLLERLRQLLELEQDYLNKNRFEELSGLAADKHRLLAQLGHFKKIESAPQNMEHAEEIIAIRNLLENNMRSLKFRIDAINELALTMEEAICSAESDGTYSL